MTQANDTSPRRTGGTFRVRSGPRRSNPAPWPDIWRWLAPFAAATALLLLGYLLREPGVWHPNDYHAFSFGSLNYSDIIWLHIRDHLADHPRPYLDYRLEYPPLTGGLTYLLSFAPSLPAYFALTYAVLALSGLATVGALGGIAGANRWYVAAAPGLVLLGGLNWDLAAIALTALALLAYARGRDVWGTLALLAAVWLKLFPIVFLGAILVERLRERRWRSLATIGALFAAGSAAINLPLANANPENWSYFFTLNNERRPEPSIWTLLPPLTIPEINTASLMLLALGGLVLGLVALRSRVPVASLLGATLLIWWLFVNKIYSPQYSLWVYLALALLAVPRPFWIAFALFDVAYYFASFQILYTSLFDLPNIVEWQTEHLVHPLVAVRLVLLGAAAAAGAYALWQLSRQRVSADARFVGALAALSPQRDAPAANGQRRSVAAVARGSSAPSPAAVAANGTAPTGAAPQPAASPRKRRSRARRK
ncbi:MAG: hypothetical protein U0841_02950 [Chloroflexia bacterium]